MAPLDSMDAYIAYAEKQAAFVSQVSLYTYIKTRAGTQWPKLFEDETYLKSMKMARWHIFGAAVADLSIYLGAMLVKRGAADARTAQDLSRQVIIRILSNYQQDDIPAKDFAEMTDEGLLRCDHADWTELAEGPAAFQPSADALIRWAPIADELKTLDEEIVRNSIHMRWINVRRDIKDNLVADAVIASA
ncbi:MAG: hypothetical protein J4F41_08430 [Alphaproteobacteria bacterium]|nr:hypothetical protein [Alphaproteobacteria bacterium]